MTTETTTWIDKTLNSLTLNQKIGQLLHPFLQPQKSEKEIDDFFKGVEPGGVFVFPGTMEETQIFTSRIQNRVEVPAIIAADLENGAGRVMKDATVFPDLMALAAANDEKLAYEQGKAAAMEGRAVGIHWTFAPVVDISANPQNPITNTRCLSDDPDKVIRIATQILKGMQDHGMCATAKHFPGDGYDCRDQHVCTTINPLSMKQWYKLSGRMFKEAIDAGVWSVMMGHISLPVYDPGDGKSIESALPATLSHRLAYDLLKGELGFDGLIISDATGMGGFLSWGPRDQVVPECINAGCDQILFADMNCDFEILKSAVEDGRLSLERVDEAVRSLLVCKHRLNLFDDAGPKPIMQKDHDSFELASKKIAEKAITIVRDKFTSLPLNFIPGKRVISYHIRADKNEKNVDAFDDLLRDEGLEVIKLDEDVYYDTFPENEIKEVDFIIVNFVYCPSWMTNRIRPNGNFMRMLLEKVPLYDSRVVFISWGSPYIHFDIPRIPALINAYSPDKYTQQAVLKVLKGDLKALGTSPVNTDFPEDVFLKGVGE
jgi:beta-N-acetylhexosaminidase